MKPNQITNYQRLTFTMADALRTLRRRVHIPILVSLTAACSASAAPIIRLGLYDAPYTDNNGRQFSLLNGADGNFASGTSLKYAGATNLGSAAWVANAASGLTTRIGFFDSTYTQTGGTQNGCQQSRDTFFNDGAVAGYSTKYNGTTYLGQATWVADAATGTTTRVGLTGSEFTYASGRQYSNVFGLQGGYVLGRSDRVGDTDSFGGAARVANIATGVTTQVGFFDAGYTQSFNDHQETSMASFQGRYGAGFSRKYNGNTYQGAATWVTDAETGVTTRVGFFGNEYTEVGRNNPGFQFSSVILDKS